MPTPSQSMPTPSPRAQKATRLLHRSAVVGLAVAMITTMSVNSAQANADKVACRGGLDFVPKVGGMLGDCLHAHIEGEGLTLNFGPTGNPTTMGEFTSRAGLCHSRMDLLLYDVNWHRYQTFYGGERNECDKLGIEIWDEAPNRFQARPGFACVKLLEGTTALGNELKVCFGITA